mmetsp:Transcript_51407/g.95069  ORF Transcript_51407/g.95069 Transcript_51407/m.95069 type:complete len:317 (-) Transcript_51407:31-981(-)
MTDLALRARAPLKRSFGNRFLRTAAAVPGFSVPPAVKVPPHIVRPSYADDPQGVPRPLPGEEPTYAEVKSLEDIAGMRKACKVAANALALARRIAAVGITTDEVDRAVSDYIISQNGYPAGINYQGFPRSLCASVNEVALHGVPNTRPLQSGDIVNFDVVAFVGGYFGDCSAMVKVGEVDANAEHLVDTTKACLDGAVSLVRPGLPLNAIGEFCSDFATQHGYGVVHEFCGHFIGRTMHMRPYVMHVPHKVDIPLEEGMTFTIEPVLTEEESGDLVNSDLDDGWTMVSKGRGCWSAQWEHTVLVTADGVEILTLPE